MRAPVIVGLSLLILLAGCTTTEFKSYEARNNVFDGRGGTKEVVDGMDIWDNGDPPRKFKILGVIEDERTNAIVPMLTFKGDIVKKAKESGGDALVHLSSSSQITGAYTQGYATARAYGNSANVSSSSFTGAMRMNISKFAVIKYLD